MLGPTWAETILWLHILAATIWIGGQVVVAAVVPLLHAERGLAAAVGRRFERVAWPAFGALVVTGIANVRNAGIGWSDLVGDATGRTLTVKLGLVLVSGAAAGAHARIQAPRAARDAHSGAATSAILGSTSVLAAMGAAFFGVVIAQS